MRHLFVPLAGFALCAFTPAAEDVRGWTLVRSKPEGARLDAVGIERETIHSGSSAIRFTIAPGDCVPEDCAEDRERVELKSIETEREGDERWYRWAFYLPKKEPDIWPARMFIAQFHQEGARPAVLFSIEPDGLVLESHHARDGKLLLVRGADLRGRWHEIALHVVWSRGDGVIEVSVDGAPPRTQRRPTMSAREVYFKIGLYRAHLERNTISKTAIQSMIVDDIQRFTQAQDD